MESRLSPGILHAALFWHFVTADRRPLCVSFHAYIEAQVKAGNIEKAFAAIRRLEECYPNNPEALSPAQGLCMVADELAKDAALVDQADAVVRFPFRCHHGSGIFPVKLQLLK